MAHCCTVMRYRGVELEAVTGALPHVAQVVAGRTIAGVVLDDGEVSLCPRCVRVCAVLSACAAPPPSHTVAVQSPAAAAALCATGRCVGAHAIAIISAQLLLWGDGVYGQLDPAMGVGCAPASAAAWPAASPRAPVSLLPALRRAACAAPAARVARVACGERHVLAVLAPGGAALGWGANEAGQCGGAPARLLSSPTLIAGLPPAVDVAVGGAHSLALCVDGVDGGDDGGGGDGVSGGGGAPRAWAFGCNVHGQCGLAPCPVVLPPVEIGVGSPTAVAAGAAPRVPLAAART